MHVFLKLSAVAIVIASIASSLHCRANDAGWYVGASVGQASIDDELDGATLDDTTTAFRVYGGFDFNSYFGVEAQYIDFGSIEESVTIDSIRIDLDADANAFGIAGVLRWPLSEDFSLSGKVGLHTWDVDLSLSGVSDSDSDEDLFFGAGAEYRFNDNWRVVGELESYRLDDVDVFVWSLGARVRF